MYCRKGPSCARNVTARESTSNSDKLEVRMSRKRRLAPVQIAVTSSANMHEVPPTSSVDSHEPFWTSFKHPQLEDLASNILEVDESGIEYFILEEGESEKPDLNYLVTSKYTGWLENGCVFDSSYTRNEASVFPLSRVIQGWQIGITKVGKTGKICIKKNHKHQKNRR